MDLNEQMQEITNNVIDNKLKDILEKQITSTITEIVKDSFREYSDFGKQLKAAISENMNVSLKKLELVNYNQFIIDIIEKQVDISKEEAVQPIKDAINNIVGVFDKKEINLSDIYERFLEDVRDDSSEEYGEVTFVVSENERYGWANVYFDPDKDKDELSCKFNFTIHRNGAIYGFRYKDWTSSQLRTVTPAILSRFDSLEKWLFKIFNSKVKVIIDEYYFETEWNRYED